MKYLGLLAMSKILKTHPKSVQSHKDLILQCLDDKDESIRLRALDLLYGMVWQPGHALYSCLSLVLTAEMTICFFYSLQYMSCVCRSPRRT